MKQLKDYLPFLVGCEVEIKKWYGTRTGILTGFDITAAGAYGIIKGQYVPVNKIVPKLRHLNDVNEEEDYVCYDYLFWNKGPDEIVGLVQYRAGFITWLRENHFDIGGLIEAGLAKRITPSIKYHDCRK